jgi:hypothetical protein
MRGKKWQEQACGLVSNSQFRYSCKQLTSRVITMSDSTTREDIRREVADLLKSELESPLYPQGSSVGVNSKILQIARQIIESNFDKSQIANLDRDLLPMVSATIQKMMSSSSVGSAHELEEINPYYTPFSSKLIRDQ